MAMAVAVASAVSFQCEASDNSISTPSIDSALPPDIQPGSPTAEVLKLVQAGVDESVIQTYISNCPSAFNLNADKIISLSDAGLPGDLVNAMIAHDKNYLSSLSSAETPTSAEPQPEQQEPVNTTVSSETVPAPEQPAPVTVNYFYGTLAPYGSWVSIDGYGQCWRPNVVIYDANWRPYCDRGNWVYTDCGWYWNSDYSWGATFHYGRWFNSPRYGWCWWPDTVWAPSWVTWRSCDNYYGWAPLPPHTVYQPGFGFYYQGKNVAVGFDFGLSSSCYTFVSASRFCDPRPRYYCVPPYQVKEFYGQTKVINDFSCNNNRFANNGVSVTVIGHATRHPIQPVPIGTLVNPGHRSWHGVPAGRHFGADAADHSNNRSYTGGGIHHDSDQPGDSRRHDFGQNGNDQTRSRPTGITPTQPPAVSVPARGQHQNEFTSRNPAPVQTRPTTVTAPVRQATPAPSQPQKYQRSGWMTYDSQNRQSARPVSPPAVTSRPTPSSGWNHNSGGTYSRPNVQPTMNNRPAVIAEAPRQNVSRPVISQPAQHYNAAPARPSSPAPAQQTRNDRGNGNQHGWFARDH